MISTFHLVSNLVKLICLTKRYNQIVNNSTTPPFKHILPKRVLSTSPYSVNCCKREIFAVVAELGCNCISRSAGTRVPSVNSSDGEVGSSGAAENSPTKVLLMQ